MTNIIPFPQPKANAEPMIWSDYWEEKIPVTDILSILDEIKKQNDNRTDTQSKL